MKLLMLVADGVEEVEALAARDTFMRAGIEVTMMGIDNRDSIISSHQLEIKVTPLFNSFDEFDALYIPGGKRGVQNLANFILLDEVIKHFVERQKLVVAICAAPSLLIKLGYLSDRKYTCYPGWQKEGDTNYTSNTVELSGNIITGRSMYFTNDLAIAVIQHLLGQEEALRIANQIKGIK